MTDPAVTDPLWQSEIPELPSPRRGKVRDVYELDALGHPEWLLIVATDRLSAYDHILRPGIPGKGVLLTQLSNFWFRRLTQDLIDTTGGNFRHHLQYTEVDGFPEPLQRHRSQLAGRAVVVRKTEVVPFECVARGYLAGSGFREYRSSGSVCGEALPAGLERASQLPEPIFTPATKAEEGHDENVSFAVMKAALGSPLARQLRRMTLDLYRRAAEHAAQRGLILADTKLEFGLVDGKLLLIDEAFTSDSSRYWPAESWEPGREPASFDKQYVRNWLDSSGWDHESPPPELPTEVVRGTLERYREAFRQLTGQTPPA
ncbi:MAG: phosphoribosylaminoimidazolesuccinocarboxamide synthase [Acidobacteriota bacterium]